ncbi:hypothetical protein TNCV_4270011 [Trichonephila clavipes]|nr:hypothetical protein TNCV_4270011 [Trichonephila clavipes]
MNCHTAYQTFPWKARSLSNSACLEYDGKATVSIRVLMTWPDNWKEIPRETISMLYHSIHVVWQLASRLEDGQRLIELVTL